MLSPRSWAISLVLLSLILDITTGCTGHPSDTVIAKDIEAEISADLDTQDSQITVASKDGKVALSGEAKSPDAQQKVEQIAREESGTIVVDNETTVPQPVVLPAGTVLTVMTSQRLSSSDAVQTFLA